MKFHTFSNNNYEYKTVELIANLLPERYASMEDDLAVESAAEDITAEMKSDGWQRILGDRPAKDQIFIIYRRPIQV